MRTANRVLAAAVALVLLVGGLLVTAEIVVAGVGAEPWLLPYDRWYRSGREHAWNDPTSRWFFIALLAAGLALLALQVARRRRTALPLPGGQALPVQVSRRSLERSVARAAEDVDGVASAKVRVTPSRARVVARADRLATAALQPTVAEAAGARLRALGLAATQVTVKVRNVARS